MSHISESGSVSSSSSLNELERAKALSLESYALESYQRNLSESGSITPIFERSESYSDSLRSEVMSRSRPRPRRIEKESSSLEPPPLSQRRPNSLPNDDLISWTPLFVNTPTFESFLTPSFTPQPFSSSSKEEMKHYDDEYGKTFTSRLPTKSPYTPGRVSYNNGNSQIFKSKSLSSNLYSTKSSICKIPSSSFSDYSLGNLIDFDDKRGATRVSILNDFDPLTPTFYPSPPIVHDNNKECKLTTSQSNEEDRNMNGSFHYSLGCYEPYGDEIQNPLCFKSKFKTADLDLIESRKKEKQNYEEECKRENEERQKKGQILFLSKEKNVAIDEEINAFVSLVNLIRASFPHDDPKTNSGIIISSSLRSNYLRSTSIKLVVYKWSPSESYSSYNESVTFTCEASSFINVIICKVLCDMEDSITNAESSNYILQVFGLEEYLSNESQLKDYEYVHSCIKYDKDVELVLVPLTVLVRSLGRTAEDDDNDSNITVEDISPLDSMKTLSYHDLKILLETLSHESERINQTAKNLMHCSEGNVMSVLRPKMVLQSVKAVCAHLGNIEILEVSESCDKLNSAILLLDDCKRSESALRPEIVQEVGVNRLTSVMNEAKYQLESIYVNYILQALESLVDHVTKLLQVYAKTFRVNFSFSSSNYNYNSDSTNILSHSHKMTLTTELRETLLVRISALHRLQPLWTYDDYSVNLQLFHGTRPISQAFVTPLLGKSESFYERVLFDTWFDVFQLSELPRESRLIFTLFGHSDLLSDDKKSTKACSQKELGWAGLQLFNFKRILAQGTFLLPLWPPETEKQIGPAPDSGSHPLGTTCPVLSIELPELTSIVLFPESPSTLITPRNDLRFSDLDFNTQEQLREICEEDIITFSESSSSTSDIIWEKRFYLKDISGALPKVLLSAPSWDYQSLASLYGLIQCWKRPEPMDILQLFLPCFPDIVVRRIALDWLSDLTQSELLDYLPQLLEALKYETWTSNPLAKVLLENSLSSPSFAHALYWLLAQALPGQTPQNSSDERQNDFKVSRYKRRLKMLMRALYTISGEALRTNLVVQQNLLKYLNDTALEVQGSKEGLRSKKLKEGIDKINNHLSHTPSALPLSPSMIVSALDSQTSSYFQSNTLPLKLNFISHTNHSRALSVIYKIGDDLRQDQLTIQMIRVMDKMWLKADLDFKIVSFSCVPTGHREGIVELVNNAKTLREIHVTGSRGVTGSFKETSLSDWLEKQNSSTLEFEKAVDNFTRSTAGYSIMTYILGICDRHNDNIMVKESGHVFHIDFGKFLGDAQMFGNFKRDRTPFVLTPDMVYVINRGDKHSQRFHDFVDLCVKGFNIIRNQGNLLLTLFALMASSGIAGVTMSAVKYVQSALLPDLSNSEAAATFARMIQESLGSWFTQWNFFIHNIGQLRFANGEQDNNNGGGGGGELLSFIPKRYSLHQDGRITAVCVYGIQKRYFPEKHYVFILKIDREKLRDPTYLFRTYKEFCELDSKLTNLFPLALCHSLPKGVSLGRQEIRGVAERRKHEVKLFLESLFSLADDVSHSELVYTFFHPILRDQEEASIHFKKLKQDPRKLIRRSSSTHIQGEIKISLEYSRDTLHVMICHAKNLNMPEESKEEPNSYVKVYLHPDPGKITKRKTRVVRKNCHPSFMETLEYRMPENVIRYRTLGVTVWSCDRFQEKNFIGGVSFPLQSIEFNGRETWYRLTNFNK